MKTQTLISGWNRWIGGIVIGLSLGACRLGNFTEKPTSPSGSVGTVKKLRTVPTRLETEVYFDGDDVPVINTNTMLQAIPPEVLRIFSNPVGLYIPAQVSGTNPALFFNTLTQSAAQATRLSPSNPNIVSSSLVTSPVTLWSDPNCKTALQIDQSGRIDAAQTGDPVDGTLNLEFTVIRVLSGSCETDLRKLAECYQDQNQCTDPEEHDASIYLFDLYARYAGVLDMTRAPYLRGLVYTVRFE